MLLATIILMAEEAVAKAAATPNPLGVEPIEGGSGLHNFLEIVTKPDNIPIVAMFFIIFYFFGLCLKMGLDNDRLTERGEREKIYERMNRWVFGAEEGSGEGDS